jgi:signal transduction histidine kinase
MKNEWFTAGFLVLLITALVTLAVLQYRWVGSVSESEKDRLKETLSASAENFAAGFQRNFRELHEAFAMQFTDEDVDWVSEIGKAYENWISIAEYPDLVEAVYYIRKASSEQPEIFLFQPDQVSAERIDAESVPALNRWMERRKNSSITRNQSAADGSVRIVNRTAQMTNAGNRSITLSAGPEFGDPSFLFIPVQLFDVRTPNDGLSDTRVQFRLNVNQPDDGVFIALNDDICKTRLIPDLARTYFSDSYEDQYHLSIIQPGSKNIYFSTFANGIPPHPDVSIPIRWSNGRTLFAYRTNMQDNGTTDSIRTSGNRFFTRSEIDNPVHENLHEPGWELWLSVTEGSLGVLVNQARTRNLMISFGVLLILGISGCVIVWIAQRSKNLSEKQMLFVTGVSHEFRTPISVIRSAAQNLSDGIIKNEARRNEYARTVLKESLRLGNMVDQIMEFSEIQSGKKTYHFTDGLLTDFSKKIESAIQPMLTEKSITLEYSLISLRQNLYADWESLLVAVMNLVQNAIKFSPENSKIQLIIEDTEWKNNKAIRFKIKDEGIGIPNEEQIRIFEPFYRSKSVIKEQIKGNGIGLSLVKKIAEAHGGGVFVQSEEGSGSTFHLIIPIDNYS